MRSLPKSRLRAGGLGVAAQQVDEELGAEDVDAHRGQRHVGLAGDAGRVGRLLDEGGDPVLVVDVHDAEADGLHPRHLEAADGDVGALVDVLLEHQLVVHLVDVVAGEDDHELRLVVVDDVDVLVDRVGGALVPLGLGDALARRKDVEALVALGAEEVPAALQVADQAVRLVLGGDADAADAGVERVRQREVDDPGLAAEVDRRLGAAVGQFLEPAAAPAGEHVGHRVARERSRSFHHASFPQIDVAMTSDGSSSSQIVASGGRVSVARARLPSCHAVDHPHVAHAAAAVDRRVGVQDLAPASRASAAAGCSRRAAPG